MTNRWGNNGNSDRLDFGGGSKITAPLITQLVNHLPAMQETWIQFLGREDALEKEMATHSSILAWRIPWTEELTGYSSQDRKSWTQLSD